MSQTKQPFPGGLAVFSGPSGSGKTSVCSALLEHERVELSVSATTRPPRAGERDGVEYHFYRREKFEALRDQGELVEWAEVYGHFYGTLKRPLVEASHRTDRMLLLDIDVQGAAQLQEQGVAAIYIFIAPPSLDALRARLLARRTDDAETIERRLRFAEQEMARQSIYDHVLVNEDLETTIQQAREILGL